MFSAAVNPIDLKSFYFVGGGIMALSLISVAINYLVEKTAE